MIVIASDFRWVRAFPVLNEGSDLDRMYKQNAERILRRASPPRPCPRISRRPRSATACGGSPPSGNRKPLLGIPNELSVLDIMCFGPPAKLPYRRWKKALGEITNWNRFDPAHYKTEAEIDDWVAKMRHKVMFRNAQNVD